MPICQNCNHQWSWSETIKKMFTLDTGMVCPSCKKKQYHTKSSQKRSTLLPFLTPVIMLFSILLNTPTTISLALLVISFFLILVIYPLLIEFASMDDPPLWKPLLIMFYSNDFWIVCSWKCLAIIIREFELMKNRISKKKAFCETLFIIMGTSQMKLSGLVFKKNTIKFKVVFISVIENSFS